MGYSYFCLPIHTLSLSTFVSEEDWDFAFIQQALTLTDNILFLFSKNKYEKDIVRDLAMAEVVDVDNDIAKEAWSIEKYLV